jgi:hypothetical protein
MIALKCYMLCRIMKSIILHYMNRDLKVIGKVGHYQRNISIQFQWILLSKSFHAPTIVRLTQSGRRLMQKVCNVAVGNTKGSS